VLYFCGLNGGKNPINLRQLRYFARTVEAGNITRAAEQLFIAQPALGLQIRQLEQDLHVTLLSRHSRGVSPTKAGRVLYEWACEILRQVDEAEREVVAAGRQEREGVVLGMTTGVMALIGRDMVVRTRQALPSVNLNLLEEMSGLLMDALEREEVDIALAYDVYERPGLLRVPLLEEEPLFVCAPSAAPEADPVQFADVIRLPLALPSSRDVIRRLLLETARRLAIEPPNVALDISSISAMKSLVANGDVATVMPYGTVFDDIERGRLVGRRIVNPTLKRTLYFVRSLRRAPIQNENALLDLLGTLVRVLVERMGPLATGLPALDGPLSAAVASSDARADAGGQEAN
jgi:LysR family transcriptional regulator, nitrogen assimilation regulatory protein